MKGDFSRNTFDPKRHFSRVLMQQGRVQLDADWNEQTDIILHYLRTLAKDLIGDHGSPGQGFSIDIDNNQPGIDFVIRPGHYYVDGILCENEAVGVVTYKGQAGYPFLDSEILMENKNYWAYLDVWERHITHVEDDSLREVAIGGPDTATRTQVVWQVKIASTNQEVEDIDQNTPEGEKWLATIKDELIMWMQQLQPRKRGYLKAKSKDASGINAAPCITTPVSRFRGMDNQLYRVEIHAGGPLKNGNKPTFKWSRENGSVVFPIRELSGMRVSLEHLGRDSRFGLANGDWVEIVDDDYILQGRAEPLLHVDRIDPINMEVTLEGTRISNVGQDPLKHPLLRRWDHRAGDPSTGGSKLSDDGAVEIKESRTEWLTLEDGVQIQFQDDPANMYRTGDYWLIPARTATGDVEWPGAAGEPQRVPPHGVEHHFAPLALITVGDSDIRTHDLRRTINKLWT
ncbi:DUF4815 domain-containing protein [bacterium]|nr:DUF4815 domain-containing protein [bacterium]